MNSRLVWAIARKDLKAVTANVQVWLPMLIVPILLGLLLPTGMVLALRFTTGGMGSEVETLSAWLEQLPAGALKARLDAFPTLNHRLIFMASNYMLAPFFLLIPLMTASVISADSFAGEKERGTLETLLFAPVDMLSLFAGKVLAALIPAVGLSLATLALCALSLNLVAWPLFQGLFFPQFNWLPLMLLVLPAVSLLAVLLNVFISARVATFQAAYQMGGVIVLPFLLIMAGQATGLVLLDAIVLVGVGLVLGIVDLLLLQQVLRRLDRNLLFASQVK